MPRIIDVKPKAGVMIDVKPKLGNLGENYTRSYQVVLSAGQPIGLLLTLTYPTIGTVTQWSEVSGVTP